MEKYLNRNLGNNELVHHKNGNPSDNRIENLELTNRKKHPSKHIDIKNYTEIICHKCGKRKKIRIKLLEWKKNRLDQIKHYCSKECSNKENLFKIDTKINKIVKNELKKGLTGYKISKKYGLNRTTVYNHIKMLQ